MKGSGMWLSRRQVRWLIVLLALLPMVPVIVTMRLTLDNARRERDDAVEEETKIYREQLIYLVTRTSLNSGAEASGEVLLEQMRRIFGGDVALVLEDPVVNRIWISGEEPSADAIEVVIRDGHFTGWTVVLDRVVELPEYIGEQMRNARWIATGWVIGIGLIAGGAWFAVNRGLKIDELRSDLLTTVSHEMKTPLASMRVLLETLADEEGGRVLSDEAQRAEYVDMALRENRRLTRLADDFLTFARLERGEHRLCRELCDLREISEAVIAELGPAIDAAGTVIETRIEPVPAWGDPDAIAAVLRNLVENALKYGATPGGLPQIVVTAALDPDGSHLSLCVEDRGPGIPAEFREAVFRRYFRVNDRLSGAGSGVGLGLAICKHLVRSMKGRIGLETPSEGGCRFVVSLKVPTAKEESVSSFPAGLSPVSS